VHRWLPLLRGTEDGGGREGKGGSVKVNKMDNRRIVTFSFISCFPKGVRVNPHLRGVKTYTMDLKKDGRK